MAFSNVPLNAKDFAQKFHKYTNNAKRKNTIDLIIRVNKLYERKSDRVKIDGIFLFYNDFIFARAKIGGVYFFQPTAMFRTFVLYREDLVTLNGMLKFSYNRGLDDCIFWEFFSDPDNIWTSALSQSYALYSYIIAYTKTGDDKYMDVADKILNTFTKDWREGGVFNPEMDWYLEYTIFVPGTRQLRNVLNCHLAVLINFYKCYELTKKRSILKLFKKGIRSLKKYLPAFIADDGRSFYSYWQATHPDNNVRDKSFTEKYHILHVQLLNQIADITGDKFFNHYVDKMMKYKIDKGYKLKPKIR